MEHFNPTMNKIRSTPISTGRITLKKRNIAKVFPEVNTDLPTSLHLIASQEKLALASEQEVRRIKGGQLQTSVFEAGLPGKEEECIEKISNCASSESQHRLVEAEFKYPFPVDGKLKVIKENASVSLGKKAKRSFVKKSALDFTVSGHKIVECTTAEKSKKKITQKSKVPERENKFANSISNKVTETIKDYSAKILLQKKVTTSKLSAETTKNECPYIGVSDERKIEEKVGILSSSYEQNKLQGTEIRDSNLQNLAIFAIGKESKLLGTSEIFPTKSGVSKLQSSNLKKKVIRKVERKNQQKVKSLAQPESSSICNRIKNVNTKSNNTCYKTATKLDCDSIGNNLVGNQSRVTARGQLRASHTVVKNENSQKERVSRKKVCSNVTTKAEKESDADVSEPWPKLPDTQGQKKDKKLREKRAQHWINIKDDKVGLDNKHQMKNSEMKNKIKNGVVTECACDARIAEEKSFSGSKESYQNQGKLQSAVCSHNIGSHSNPSKEPDNISGKRWTRSMTLRKASQKRQRVVSKNRASPPKNPKLNGETAKVKKVELAEKPETAQSAIPQQEISQRGRKKDKQQKASIKTEVGSYYSSPGLKFVGAHCSIAG